MSNDYDKGYKRGKEEYKFELIIWAGIGVILGLVITCGIFVANGHLAPTFDPTTDCQEVWDMYPYVSETFDASHAVWAKLGLTDLKVHEFEYCINHVPWGNYDG